MVFTKRGYGNGQIVYADDMDHMGTQYDEALEALLNHTYLHEQAVPESTWNITHPLKRYPGVTVVDSAGTVVIGEIEYLDSTHIVLTFKGGFSGKAYLT
ncbi:MAG: hypothetical protein WCK39_00095 [Methanomassiliicoccales archaeon]